MKLRAYSLMGLALLLGGLAACGTEKVDADAIFLSDSNATYAGPPTYFESVFRPSDRIDIADGAPFRLRIDGRWVLYAPETPDYVVLTAGTQSQFRADSLLAGTPSVEIVDSSGKVVLRTAPLILTPLRGNQLVVYGSRDNLQYQFFTYSPAELDGVPAEQVMARVLNARADEQAINVSSCPATVDMTSLGTCTPVKSGLAYGELWQQLFPRDTKVLVQGLLWSIDLWCVPPDGNTKVTPEIVTYVASASNAYFELYDGSGIPAGCMPVE
jgi:hypothetical protein